MESVAISKNTRDITGQRFGKLVALRPTEQRVCGQVVWECRCDCGEITFVASGNLRRGNTRSCGCLHSQVVSEASRNDLQGKRFGRLTVIAATEKRQNGSVVWQCRCDCGNSVLVSAADLQKGDTSSCGCLQKENLAKRRKVDLAGRRFGYLTAVQATQRRVHGCVVWQCRCDCGESIDVSSERLTGGLKISCGCISRKEYEQLHS